RRTGTMARTADVPLGDWSSESASWSFPLVRLGITVQALHVDGSSVSAGGFVVDRQQGRLVWSGTPPNDPAGAYATVSVAGKPARVRRHWWIPVGVALIGATGAASGAVVQAVLDGCPAELEQAERSLSACSRERATVAQNLVHVGRLCAPSSEQP